LAPSLVCPPIAGRFYESYGFGSNLAMGAVSVIGGVLLFALLLHMARSSHQLAAALIEERTIR